ncbi:MAG: response regulator [Spirochaetales bacterium]
MVRVLVVDDLPFMRQALREAIESAKMQCVGEAANGRAALDMYHRTRPDVVVLDITMPEMDGIEALERLMNMDPDARVVMCSAIDEEAMIIRAIQLGARDFVVKPFRASRIANAVRKAAMKTHRRLNGRRG